MKVFVITIDEVYDFENFKHEPMVFSTYEKAKAEFDSIKEDAKREYGKQFGTTEEGETYFEIYADGYFSECHYTIHLNEVEVQ